MNLYINNLRDSSKINISLVGGKAANLIELSKLNDIQVPEGFCITTEAFKKVFANNSEFNALLDQLSFLDFGDKEKIQAISKKLQVLIESEKNTSRHN